METYNPNFALLDSQNEFFSEENYEVSDTAWELLHGAIDTHVHSTPHATTASCSTTSSWFANTRMPALTAW